MLYSPCALHDFRGYHELAAALIPFATGYIDLNNLSTTAAGMEWYYVGFSVLGLTVIGFALEEIYRGRKS